MKLFTISTLTALAITLAACGSSSSSDDQSDINNSATSGIADGGDQTSMPDGSTPTPAAFDAELNGTWTSGCEDENDVTNTEVNNDLATVTAYTYSDAECTGAIVIETIHTYSFEYPEGSVTTPLGEANFINRTVENVTVNGETQLIPDLGVAYDIYLITDDGKWYTGDIEEDGEGESEATRPQTLADVFVTRL